MIKLSLFTNQFAAYSLFFLLCTNSYSHSQDDFPEATTTEIPTEAPEPAENNYDNCDLPYLGGDQAKPAPENLLRMGPNSKYFILAGENNIPIKEVAEFCESIGLQPAEVRHSIELLSMEVFLHENVPEDVVFSLGINDEKDEGNFVEYDGTPMRFHSFAEGQPDNKMNTESCVEVSFHKDFPKLVYNDVNCNEGTTPVCMFKPTDNCFLGSPLTLANVKDEFALVGSSSVRDYYVKLKQHSWSEAAAACATEGFKLVDFNTGLSNNQVIYDLIKKWIERNFLFKAIPFWTGARLVPTDTVNPGKESGNPQFKFESSGKPLNDLSEWPSLVWDAEEPSDSSGLGLEECISAILYNPYKSTGDNVFTLATTNCRIPHYPICYQEKSFDTINETQTAAEASEEEILGGRSSIRDPNAGKFCSLDDIKIDLSEPHLTVNELLQLAAVSRHKDIHTDDYRFRLAGDRIWLASFMDEIFRIPREVCPGQYVPPAYLNIMHNLLILYYNALADRIKDPEDSIQQSLKTYAANLHKCSSQVQPIHLNSVGGLPTTFGKLLVTPITEVVDFEEDHGDQLYADMIIDTFWYLFQVTVASCYPHVSGSKIYWLQDIYNLFTTYYLELFQQRWFSGKIVVDYGVIMGDMDVEGAYYSVRACAIGTFHRSNISDLYFPRPVFLKRQTSDKINLKNQNVPDLPEVDIDKE